MHFEILVEDVSGKKALDILVPNIIGNDHTFRVTSYKGLGHLPKNLKAGKDASKRIMLDQLPKLLKGFGRTFAGRSHFPSAVIVVCDLDQRCLHDFRKELYTLLDLCAPKPETRFCIAIEEGEAWLLGDIPAIKSAYPQARDSVLTGYENDSICGTWECLADAICQGGAAWLINQGRHKIGLEKSVWAEQITPHMNVERNVSPSFNYLRKKMRELACVS